MRKYIYKSLLWSHRWLGIIVGLHFVLLGLSGSYLVYADELDALLKPHLMKSSGASQSFNLTKTIASAQVGLKTDKPPMRVQIAPRESGFNHKLTFNIPEGDQKRRFITAYVDSANLEFKGEENFRKTLRGFLFIFHHDLFSGRTGRTIIAVSGVLSLVLLIGGLYLWWPRGGKTFRRVLTYNRKKNFLGLNIELHKLSGFYSLVLMLVVTFSGVFLARPDWFTTKENGGKAPAASSKPFADLNSLGKDFQDLLDQDLVAQLRFDIPAARMTAHARPGNDIYQNWKFSLENGDILTTQLKSTRSFGMIFADLQRIWHVGHFWGEFGRFLIFLSGLLPLFFYFTGFYIWLKKRAQRLQ